MAHGGTCGRSNESEQVDVYSRYSRLAGSTRVRLYDWLDYLRVMYREHSYVPAPTNSPDALRAHWRDVVKSEAQLRWPSSNRRRVLMGRGVTPFGHGGPEENILNRADWSVFDFDDAIYLPSSGSLGMLSRPDQKFMRCVTAADAVIAGNDVLADHASSYSDNVVVIPSCVEPSQYVEKTTWDIAKTPRLIWIGSRSSERFLVDITASLWRVHQLTGAELILLSSPATNVELCEIGPMIRRVPWNERNFAKVLASADIAVAPLRDGPWERGKCAYKLLQYAATGLPIAGSPIGANRAAMHAFGGVSVEGDDWAGALVALINASSSQRKAMGQRGVAGVKEQYSFTRWGPVWRATLKLAGS